MGMPAAWWAVSCKFVVSDLSASSYLKVAGRPVPSKNSMHCDSSMPVTGSVFCDARAPRDCDARAPRAGYSECTVEAALNISAR